MDDGAAQDLEKRGRGRPPTELTECQKKRIAKLAGEGLNLEEIAAMLDIPRRTFYRIKKREKLNGTLYRGKIAANAKVKQSLFRMATKGKSFSAAQFWAKCRMDWIEADKRKEIETGGNQKVIVIVGDKPKELEGKTINVTKEQLLAAALQEEEPSDE